MTNTTDSVPAPKPLELVPSAYFDCLIARMGRSGYKLFSRVAIDTNDCAYHVNVRYARETRLFFHLPNKKLIIQFDFTEHDNPDWPEPWQYWTIRFYPVFKSIERLVEMTYVPFQNRNPDDDSSPLDNLPLYAQSLAIPGFRPISVCKYEQKSVKGTPPDPERLATTIVRLLYPVLKYIGYGQFKYLQVTDFWPHYTFPSSHQIFWSRFNNEAFKQIVLQPRGGDPIR